MLFCSVVNSVGEFGFIYESSLSERGTNDVICLFLFWIENSISRLRDTNHSSGKFI